MPPKRGSKPAEKEPPAAKTRAAPKGKAEPPVAKSEPEPQADEDYDSWPVAKLKTRLVELGSTSSGSKQILVDRLKSLSVAKATKSEATGSKRGAAKATAAEAVGAEVEEKQTKRSKTEPEPKAKAKSKGRDKEDQAADMQSPAKRGKVSKVTNDQTIPSNESNPAVKLEAASQIHFEDGEFTAAYAKSAGSTCKRCQQKIGAGLFRIGKMVQSDKFDGKYSQWHHATCFLEGGLLPRSTKLISGFSSLKPEDQQQILAVVPKEASAQGTASEVDAKGDEEMRKQNEQIFKVIDALSQLSQNQLREMMELNDYPSKKLHVSSTMAELCADGILFGACDRCEECADAETEKQGGHILLDGECYKCVGYVSEFLKCTFKTQRPIRRDWQLTDAAKSVIKGVLGNKPLKTGTRLFAHGVADQQVEGAASSSDPPKPVLLGLNFFIETTSDETSRDELSQLVRSNGGTMMEAISRATYCVISTNDSMESNAQDVETAKKLEVPGVTEDFVKDCVEQKEEVDMTTYLLWGEARRRKKVEEGTSSRFIDKQGVSMDADVGDLINKAHVLVDRGQARVYSEMMTLTDMIKGSNSFYTMHLLESDEKDSSSQNSFWIFRKWGRIGSNIGGTKIEEFGTNKDKAIKSFCSQYLDKTGNTFGHNRDAFVPKTGKFVRVDVSHKALQKNPTQDNKQEEGNAELQQGGQPLGQLSKQQIEKADKVLDRIAAALAESAAMSKFLAASAEYYSMVPHDFGLKMPPVINNEDLLGRERALLQFYIRMGFEEIGQDDSNLAPIAGVMQLELAKSLLEASKGICKENEVKNCTKKGATMHAKKAGSPQKPMSPDLYGAILLYTSNAIYQALNKALRDENREQVMKYFPYLRMLFEACARLPQQKTTLWRGVGVDLFSTYKVGSTITWWGVSSCTSDQKVAENFANGCAGKSTILTVEAETACNISEVSFYANESESILLPGTQLQVVSSEQKGNRARIRLKEVGRAVS